MRTLRLALLIPCAALIAVPARADTPAASCPLNEDGIPECSKPKLEVGVRTGVSLPLGNVAAAAPLGDAVDAQVPILLELGVRPDPHLFVGAFGSYGFVAPASGVCQGGSCSGSDVRVGLEALYHFRPARRFDPWIGVGTGYEWLHASASSAEASRAVTLRGFEIVNVQAGLDYAVCSGLRVGPFASFSLGEYDHANATWTGGPAKDGGRAPSTVLHEQSQDIPSTALHEWLTLGLRGSFDL